MSGKNAQRKMTEVLTDPAPVSVAYYLHAHPYQDGSEYLQALRTACQLNSTLDEVKTLVEKKRQEMEKFDRQEKVLFMILGLPNDQRSFFEALLRAVKEKPKDIRAGCLAPMQDRLSRWGVSVSIQDLEWYMRTLLINEPRVIYQLNSTQLESWQLLFRDARGKPFKFALLVFGDRGEVMNAAFTFVALVRNSGCEANLKRTPDISEGTLNVIVELTSPEWDHYPVKFYSLNLIVDAFSTMKFEIENISQYEVK